VRESSLEMTVALIVAAGSGERLGAGRPKALIEVAGRPLVWWSVAALRAAAGVEEIVVALPAGSGPLAGVRCVEGGETRSESVRSALAASTPPASGEQQLVLVQDAARPLLTAELAELVIAALEQDGSADAAIAAAPVSDTIKRADAAGAVVATLDRSELWAVQTPQVFRREALERALRASPQELAEATDDASLIERGGGRVIVVAVSEPNLKVTTASDLNIAELLLAARPSPDRAENPA
jgi:2-C-methyl-D-erythritol 4-phosphate cytidylyltransferase